MELSAVWKLVFAVILLGAIIASACVHAPRQPAAFGELRRLVICALGLYAVGGLALLTHHAVLAGLVYGVGTWIAALAAWLSRGRDQDDPPGGDQPMPPPPGPDPDGLPRLEWARFERDFREYARRERTPT
ncbi:MAG TPA: hypothetical protein VIK04_17890 [Solirubrobacteraceae bacterium]